MRVKPAKLNKKDIRVILFENHPDHPDGQIFIDSASKTTAVAPTPAVLAKIESGELKKVGK